MAAICSALVVFLALLVEYEMGLYEIQVKMKLMCFQIVFRFPHKMQKSENDPAVMVVPIFLVFWAFTFIFLYCELGKAVTDEFINFDEDLCQCKWYLLSADIQRMMIIFMNDSQQPVLLHGFGNFTCTRDSFKNVIAPHFQYIWKGKILHDFFFYIH